MKLESGPLEGQLAELDSQHNATPERLAAARQLFEEVTLDELEVYGSTGRKLRHRESGAVFVVAEEQVLMAADPRKTCVKFFLVSADRIWFLRPRGFDAVERGIPGEIIAGELRRAPGGGVKVVDVRSGRVVRENVRL
jgi:hypothetical protein